jgi:hypothetical protein
MLKEVENRGGDSSNPELFTWRYELNTLAWAILIVVTSMLLKKVGQLLRLWLMGSRLPGPPLQTLVARSVNCAKAAGPLKLLGIYNPLFLSNCFHISCSFQSSFFSLSLSHILEMRSFSLLLKTPGFAVMAIENFKTFHKLFSHNVAKIAVFL